MPTLLIAILVNYVLRFIASVAVTHYIKLRMTEEELMRSIPFNLWATLLIINHGLFYINLTVLAAYLIKIYLL